MEKLNTYTERIINLAVDFAPKALMAIAVLIIGWFIVKQITKVIRKSFGRSKVSAELQPFIISFVSVGLKIILITVVAGIVGIETASLTALLAATGFAVGLAIQGNLSNFAAGVLILFFRPFKIDDEVIVQGDWVYVKEIHIFHTIFRNFDGTIIIMPNSFVMSGKIQNNSYPEERGIKFKLNVPYTEDLNKIYDLLVEAASGIPEINTEKKPFFWIQKFDDYFIRISIQFKAKQEGFWSTEVKANKAFYEILTKNNIKITYPIGAAFGKYGDGEPPKIN